MKGRYGPRSITMVTILLAGLALVLWGVGMYCLTAVTAEYAANRYLNDYEDLASTAMDRHITPWYGETDLPYANYQESHLWEAVASSYINMGQPVGPPGSNGFLARPDSRDACAATAIYDAQGNLMECSWKDFFYFEYLTEQQWANREARSMNNARAFFDRDMLTDAGRELSGSGSLHFDAAALRFTGAFDGVEFIPVQIDYIDGDSFYEALWSQNSSSDTVSGAVQDHNLSWTLLYENSDAVPSGTELVTLYSDWFDVCYTPTSPAFSYNGSSYDNVAELTARLGPELADGYQQLSRYEGLDLLIVSVEYCYHFGGETYFSPYYYGPNTYQDEAPEMNFYLVSAVYCSPWRTAFGELRYVYIHTLLLAAVLVLIARSAIKRRLIRPVRQLGEVMADTDGRPEADRRAWREARLLEQHAADWADTLRMRKNEIARLNTALEYARTAEENRRQMTSSIAHELKTPLAVIHSYAEGLKEHIAEDKRDKYVSVILAETERTDGIVLEMLDLSRLEAGKVKLARDDFSLAALTRSIFDKLDRAIQAKELKLFFSLPEEFPVTADESRISQVIENFATNAVKYTSIGGYIMVTIRRWQGRTSLFVENESSPLSPEALDKVWDTFYRADESRSGEGTGLGLAIAKSIIELHGGQCAVRNTAHGVEFSFTI